LAQYPCSAASGTRNAMCSSISPNATGPP
jgi:hypothetical protein